MTKRRKSDPSRKRRRAARKAELEPAYNTVDLSDRLYNVMAELSVVSDAVVGSELGEPKVSGLLIILRRQIDEVRSLNDIIHPWPLPSREETAS